ncbi:hypothetical protein ACWOCD_00555 [Enterococcus silesiacus]
MLKESELLFGGETILTKAVISGAIALMIVGIFLAVGFQNKSVISTIVTARVLCSVLNNTMQLEKGLD